METTRHADRAALGFDHYLTLKQQTTFRQLSPQLQERIKERLLGSGQSEKAQRILEIVRLVPPNPTLEKFFLTLIDAGVDQPIPQVLELAKAGHGPSFFQFATTRKREYFDGETLRDVVATFQDCLTQPALFPLLPPYDEGGKEYVKNRGGLVPQTPVLLSLSFSALLDADVYLITFKSQAIRTLSSLPSHQRLSIEIFVKFLKRLQSDAHLPLKEYEKVALLKLILMTTTRETPQIYTAEDLAEALDMAVKVHNQCGEEALLAFCKAPNFREGQPLYDAIRGLHLLSTLSDDLSMFQDLQLFGMGKYSLDQFLESLENKIAAAPFDPTISPQELDSFIQRFSRDKKNVSVPLSAPELQKMEKQFASIQRYCQEWHQLNMRLLVKKAVEIRSHFLQNQAGEEEVLQLIAIGRLALRLKFNRYPYPTQVLAILGLLGNSKGRLAQVKTGEGKSIIVALHAFVLAMQGRGVDIISSSPNLAVRDQGYFKEFFSSFGIVTSHICERERLPEHFRGQILYGTATDFEFALMEEKLLFKKLFRERQKNFDCVIVDEIDNLTIDTLLNGARLAYPAEVSYEWVYLPILQFLQSLPFATIPLSDLPASLRVFLRSYMQGRFAHEAEELTDSQLMRWLQSGVKALNLSEKNDYILREKANEKGKRKLEVLIVDDENTGRFMVGSRWSNGLHEMIEAKHGIEIQRESLTPISFSHVNFYNLYRRLDGLTGTVGSADERKEVHELYGIESFDAPTYRPSQRIDCPPVIYSSDEEYFRAIRESVAKMRQRGRPVLVLCATIQDSENIAQHLSLSQIPHQLLNEMQSEEEATILDRAGQPGCVTIATNTAGRGTDIILKGDSSQRGGLHVLLTFYPKSKRVEDQAIGRAGRQGEPGSSEIFLSSVRLTSDNVVALAQQRDRQTVRLRLVHARHAAIERFCFPLTDGFFKLFGQFHALLEDDLFITRNADKFSRLLIRDLSQLTKPAQIHPKDLLLREQLIQLLTTAGVTPVLWKGLLKQIGERMKEKTLLHWSLAFCQKIEEQLSEMQESDLDVIQRNIQELYDRNRQLWQDYFEPSGSGIATFIRELTGLDLSKILYKK